MNITLTTAAGSQDITEYVAALQGVALAVEQLEHAWYVTGVKSSYDEAEKMMVAAMERLRAVQRTHGLVSSIDDLKAMIAAKAS